MQKKGIIGIVAAIVLLGGGAAGYYYHEQAKPEQSTTRIKPNIVKLDDNKQVNLKQFGFAFDKQTKGAIIDNKLFVTVNSDQKGKFSVNFQVKSGYGFTSASVDSADMTIDKQVGGVAPTVIVSGQLTTQGMKQASVRGVIKLKGVDNKTTTVPMTVTVNNRSAQYRKLAKSNLELALGTTQTVEKTAQGKQGEANYNKKVAADAASKQAKRDQAMANSGSDSQPSNSSSANKPGNKKSGNTGTVTAMMSRQGYTGVVVAMDDGSSKSVVMRGGAGVSVGQHVSVSASAPTFEKYTTKAGKTYSGYVSWGSVSPAGK